MAHPDLRLRTNEPLSDPTLKQKERMRNTLPQRLRGERPPFLSYLRRHPGEGRDASVQLS